MITEWMLISSSLVNTNDIFDAMNLSTCRNVRKLELYLPISKFFLIISPAVLRRALMISSVKELDVKCWHHDFVNRDEIFLFMRAIGGQILPNLSLGNFSVHFLHIWPMEDKDSTAYSYSTQVNKWFVEGFQRLRDGGAVVTVDNKFL